MSKYLVQKFVKAPVRVMVEANDEFEALRNVAYGNWDSFDYTNDVDEWVIEGIEGNESSSADYTTIYDEDGNEVRYMSNDVADSYID